MFTYFTDRDGKMQLESLAQSGFDPLSRTCRFMLTEEAHHMFVGETGVGRVIERTCQRMNEAGITDPTDINAVRELGVIDLPTIQKKVNLHYTLSLDLFGAEVSTNAANSFNWGLKGRYRENKLEDDHQLKDATYPVLEFRDGQIERTDAPAISAINMRLRDDYSDDARGGVKRWNQILAKHNIDFELTLPHEGFNRQIGTFAGAPITPSGEVVTAEEWQKRRDEWLPNSADGDFVHSLMKPVWEPWKFADWIAPPKVGIDSQSGDFEYVKIHMA
jgi:benzoyl-CoA 2,3-dioxygenase component B